MKYLFWTVLILTLVFTLPPWVSFSATVFLVFFKKMPLLSIGVIGILLDVMYRVQLFGTVPLYSLLGFSISLVMPWVFRRLAW